MLVALMVTLAFAAPSPAPTDAAAPAYVERPVAKPVWHTDFDSGQRAARASNRPMLVNFTGSDWCRYCILLKEEVFDGDEFARWAQDYVLVEIDFPLVSRQPREIEEQNDRLAEKYRIQGYPTVILMHPDGKEIGRLGYARGGAKVFIGHAERLLGKTAPSERPAGSGA